MATTFFLIFFIVFIVLVVVVYSRLKVSTELPSNPTSMDDFEVLEIQVSKNLEQSRDVQLSALAAENMFAAIHGLLREDPSLQENFSFEILSSGVRGIKFFAVVPTNALKFVESQIYAHYPEAHINVVEDYTGNIDLKDRNYEIASIVFSKPDYFPLKGFRDFETDPLSSLTSTLASIGVDEEVWFQVNFRPLPDVWQGEGQDYVKAVREGTLGADSSNGVFSNSIGLITKEITEISTGIFTGMFTYKQSAAEAAKKPEQGKAAPTSPRLSPTQELEIKSIENKLSRMGFETVIRIFSSAESKERVDANLRSFIAALKQYTSASLNGFTPVYESNKELSLKEFKERQFIPDRSIVLNTEELATLFHLPSTHIDTPNISWVYSRKSEPPASLPTDNCNYIGYTTFRSKKTMFGLSNGDDRLRHMYLIGKSGTGKSTLLETMISQDIMAGHGVGVLDPHGETIDRVLERIPDHRINDVIYFDPSDTERPMGLNLLEMSDPNQKNLMASGLVAAIKQHFEYSWGPRLEYLLNYAILTLLEVPGTTIMGITRLMEDPNYLKFILHQVQDPVVIKFWEKEFKEIKGNQKMVTEAISPIQNKVNRFLASTTIRNILGQAKSTLDLWDAMNSGKILLMNLSKGKIGADNSNLLGALLVSRLQFFALQRASIPYEQRRPFYLYVDEFQNFATGSFEEILSESRKYKLGLYLTHQFTAQLPEQLMKAVFGNVGTIAAFSLGAPDARVLASEFAPYFNAEDIISLERFYIYIKLMVNGMTSHPFSGRIIVPWEEENFMVPRTSNRDAVVSASRMKYGVDREYVQNKINKWVNTPFDKGMAIALEYKDKKVEQPVQQN